MRLKRKEKINYPIPRDLVAEFQEMKAETGKSIHLLIEQALRFAFENKRLWK